MDTDTQRAELQASMDGLNAAIDRRLAEIEELRAENTRLREALLQIADTENPEHYGNARDTLHAVKTSACVALFGAEPDYEPRRAREGE